ncbi:MAG TPA: carbohydrate kinase family protein [Actinocrinis sp.]|nr:carbohydrate kinase family protein [Actinocrinis sp.]
MRIAITGSIATDHLTTFPGRFAEHLVGGQLDKISLSFLVDDLDVRRGGVAANICFGLARLGLRPLLVGAAGPDFTEYRAWLEKHGVDTESVHISATRQSPRFMCVTDRDLNQIASFYSGAMTEAREIDLRPLLDRVGGLDLLLVSPNDPAAMLRHTEQCRELGVHFAADPSQQLARLEPEEVRSLVAGAGWLFTNEYESALLQERTGWTHEQVLDRVGSWVTTKGADGVVIERAGEEPVLVGAVPARQTADPTGIGDAFRAGFLAGIGWDWPVERSAQLGCTLATVVLESVGTQEYPLTAEDLTVRITEAYGSAVAEAIEPSLAKVS